MNKRDTITIRDALMAWRYGSKLILDDYDSAIIALDNAGTLLGRLDEANERLSIAESFISDEHLMAYQQAIMEQQ